MHDPNRLTKWLLVIGLVVIALLVLYPPSEKLKGGIDLVGGTTFLFEIDTTGLTPQQQRGLSTRVMNILKERVDPSGQLNVEWRPVGNTRIEVRMPRPPKEALARRGAYNEALDRLQARNLKRFDVELALSTEASGREAAFRGLHRGVEARTALLATLKSTYDGYQEARGTSDAGNIDAKSSAYEDAFVKFLATSLPITRLEAVLALPPGDKRDQELDRLRTEFPSHDAGDETDPAGKLLTKAVTAYDAWSKNKADLEDPSDLKRRLRGAGVLEFRILADRDATSPSFTASPGDPALRQPLIKYTEQLARYGPRPRAGDRYRWFPVDNVVAFMQLKDISEFEAQKVLPSQPIVEEYTGRYYVLSHNDAEYGLLRSQGGNRWKLVEAYTDRDPLSGQNVVSFRLDPRGGQKFGELTGNNIERNLCIVLDNTAMSHAVIKSRITERGQITGRFTSERVQDLVRTLEAGSLPARLKDTPLMENTIGPGLGETNRRKGLNAVVWGTLAVLVFMLFYYGLAAGGMADIALLLNLLFVLSVMALLQATFTLPGIAGLILTVGMAVDANVLIFERIREERDRGVMFRKALNTGYDRAFSTIMDANLTTLIICVILGFSGTEEIKGFAITLGIGITTSMFTSLFVTKLVFNTLIAKGLLKDFSMRRFIGCPTIDWLGLRRRFWPISIVAATAGLGLFLGASMLRTENMYDIEFLGGTSLRIDLKPGITMTDEEMTDAITADRGEAKSAVKWLNSAADRLTAAEPAVGETPGQYTLTSSDLNGDQMVALTRQVLESRVQRGGIEAAGHTATFYAGSDLTLTGFKNAIAEAAVSVRKAAERLRGARVQSVGEIGAVASAGQSYEVATIETNRELVQAAILATLGDRLAVQQKVSFTALRDEDLTRESFFVVERGDSYLSDVIGGESNYDVRRFRGGAAVVVQLDEQEQPMAVDELEKRLREVGLMPEFDQYHTRESTIFPLGPSVTSSDGRVGYKQFAVLAADDALIWDDDQVQWVDQLARPHLAQVEAALGQEKSFSKVVQFAATIAAQTRNRAIFAIVLALGAIVAYLWFRFGSKEYGLAAIVALVHDVAITLGLVALSQFVYSSFVGRALGLDAFRVDLPMIAAVLTVIGYSLNDSIVVFDRIRENRGRVEALNPRIINMSLNQTLSRTLLTSATTFLVVGVMYVFGGKGVHGFSFALLIGIVVGTYSSLGIATPLLYRPKVLHGVVTVLVALGVIGAIFAATDQNVARGILGGLTVAFCVFILVRAHRGAGYLPTGQPVGA